jgi:hypothetical protein
MEKTEKMEKNDFIKTIILFLGLEYFKVLRFSLLKLFEDLGQKMGRGVRYRRLKWGYFW